ncbi:hypothetical protein O6H91_11G055300 [Diphasiastrum complanatum]|nr:hypothetical protein O6H91_11G055300 [Diphasiastrum complanatum]KAJ7538585.1 hypothetical protein O6H91_11G055300 [Diphasiastrum complanatum]KAJ7538586.1 hypothetical protein O6H91_11G055300 [Diphasiastrum complanatum]
MLSLTFSEADQDCLSLLTPADLQKTTLHFISTVFQHHALYRFCFTKERPIKTQSENVYVETAIVPPLWEALIAEEVEEQQKEKLALFATAKPEEKAKQEVAIKAESEALANEKAIKEDEERKHKPVNLEDAIELVVREKINEAKKMLTKEFELQEQALLEKLKQV